MPRSACIEEAAEVSQLAIPQTLQTALDGKGIRTLDDVRAAGGLRRILGSKYGDLDAAGRTIDAHAQLYTISTNLALNASLIERGFTSIDMIAGPPAGALVEALSGVVDPHDVLRLHRAAKRQKTVLDNVVTMRRKQAILAGVRSERASGSSSSSRSSGGTVTGPTVEELTRGGRELPDIAVIGEDTPTPEEDFCQCRDCEAAVSPAAYLADLLAYAVNYRIERPAVGGGTTFIDVDDLTTTLRQPFLDLAASCEAVEEQVRQVRICVEVLRSYVDAAGVAPSVEAEAAYRLRAYTELLVNLGTSFEELRLARSGTPIQRTALADRLGIDVANLDALLLDPLANEGDPIALTEVALERLFGLGATRDVGGAVLDPLHPIQVSELQQRRLDHLHAVWTSQDHPGAAAAASRRPIIDPDVIGPQHLSAFADRSNPAYVIWRQRRDFISARLAAFRTRPAGAGQNVGAFDAWVEVELNRALARSPANPVSMAQLLDLKAKNDAGSDIDVDIAALNLTRSGFSYLLRVRALVDGGSAVLATEWEELYSILLQVEKLRLFPRWREIEKDPTQALAIVIPAFLGPSWMRPLVLGPEHFTLPKPSPLRFPPDPPQPLPMWRATAGDRRDWEDLLQSRIDQEATVVSGLRAIVGAAEEGALPLLREVLIDAAVPGSMSVDDKAKLLTKRLFIDMQLSACQTTTRVSQAIVVLQELLRSRRNPPTNDPYPQWRLRDGGFDQDWEWLGSYPTWRAAMFVYLYPENILHPALRRWRSSGLEEILQVLRLGRRLGPDSANILAQQYADYYADVTHLDVQASCQAGEWTYFYALAPTGAAYWSRYTNTLGAAIPHTSWRRIASLSGDKARTVKILAAVPFSGSTILVFAKTRKESAEHNLVVARQRIADDGWTSDEDPDKLELPRNTTNFEAVVSQTRLSEERPVVLVNTGTRLHALRLNASGDAWEDAEPPNLYDDPNFLVAERDVANAPPRITLKALVPVYFGHKATCFALGFYHARRDDRLRFTVFRTDKRVPESYPLRLSPATVTIRDDVWLYADETYPEDALQSNRPVYSDRDFVWTNVPASFEGLRYLQPKNYHKYSSDDGIYVLSFEVNQPVTVYVAYDPRIAARPDWLQSWTAYGGAVPRTTDPDSTERLFLWKQFGPGKVTLGPNVRFDATWNDDNKSMYSVIVAPRLEDACDLPGLVLGEGRPIELHMTDPVPGNGWIGALASPSSGDVLVFYRRLIAGAGYGSPLTTRLTLEHYGTIPTSTTTPAGGGIGRTSSPLIAAQPYHAVPSDVAALAVDSGSGTDVARVILAHQLARTASHWSAASYPTEGNLDFRVNAASHHQIVPTDATPQPLQAARFDQSQQARRSYTEAEVKAHLNSDFLASTLAYVEEYYSAVPLLLALELQRRGFYREALDWFRTLYDHSQADSPRDSDGSSFRKIWYGLRREELPVATTYERADDWLKDPLNPHAIASTRPHSYTRFTLLSLVRCLLDYADSEFTIDSPETLPRADANYITALDLLAGDPLGGDLADACSRRIGDILIKIGEDQRIRVDVKPGWLNVLAELEAVANQGKLLAAADEIEKLLGGPVPPAPPLDPVVAIEDARNVVSNIPPNARRTIRMAVDDSRSRLAGAYATALADEQVFSEVRRLGLNSGLRAPARGTMSSGSRITGATDDSSSGRRYYSRETDTLAPGDVIVVGYVPAPSLAFCIPPNPVVQALWLHANLNLYKLRSCRNIAGMEREVEPYAAPTDTESGLPMIGATGTLVLPGAVRIQPTAYRYSVLIERARQLAQQAQQFETTMLAALEKRDEEYYKLLRARQDVRLTRAGVRLQSLRLQEAEHGVVLAELQKRRAEIQLDHFTRLLEEGISDLEAAAIGFMVASAAAQLTANAIYAASAWTNQERAAQAAQAAAGALGATSQILSTYASYERRAEEWTLQKQVAQQDTFIGDQQIILAQDQTRIVGQEFNIAEIQADQAEATADFLANKFTNTELYDWMSSILEGVYAYFLHQATAAAKLAEQQLAFERQEIPQAFVQADYWEAPGDTTTGSIGQGKAPDRRGLTGSARLLLDIGRLESYAFETGQRKHHLTKTISLARLAPVEFARFRETGVMTFATSSGLFDREFPGYYLRLIKRVRTTVIGLIPPPYGIHATLSTTGLSRVVIGPDVFQPVVARQAPQSVALSSPRDATGVFEFQAQSEFLNPFEGLGVDTMWEFRMPRAANVIDYASLADILVTLEYTALDSIDYRQQVIERLGTRASGDRPFSFRYQLPDQWYDLHNPDRTAAPMVVNFETRREDFAPNLDRLRIDQAIVYFARGDGGLFEIEVKSLRFRPQGAGWIDGGGATSVDGIVSTRRGNAGNWIDFVGGGPIGEWELSFADTPAMRDRFKKDPPRSDRIEDILFVITYSGETPAWPN